jgi:DNA modification methylase
MDQQARHVVSSFCIRCNAWRGELGQEPTLDLFIAHLVDVFREVKRVLRPDGTLWLNLGDSYCSHDPGGRRDGEFLNPGGRQSEASRGVRNKAGTFARGQNGLKPKDLMMVPARLALALQEPYTVPTCVKDERDRAWLAAMFDGEGTIGIRRHRSNRRAIEQEYQDGYVVYTSLTNNDVPLIDRCVELTGYGKAAVKQRANTTDGRGIVSRFDSYGWRLDGNAAVDVIRAIYPYLIVKRKQAILAYNLDLSNKRGREMRGNGRLPQSEQEKREMLYDLIKRANQRQEIDIPSWCEEPKPLVEPGWYLRSQLPWLKRNSMPESATDRPTSAVEYVYLLTKRSRYFWDAEAVKRAGSAYTVKAPDGWDTGPGSHGSVHRNGREKGKRTDEERSGRNLRNSDLFFDSLGLILSESGEPLALDVNPAPFKEAHFATFPPKLVRPLILAGTSERGACPACGAPWRRVVERENGYNGAGRSTDTYTAKAYSSPQSAPRGPKLDFGPGRGGETIGWQPGCTCDAGEPVPCVCLDPFGGSGTVGLVADQLGRDSILIDLNPEYVTMAKRRITGDAPLFAEVEAS